MSAHPSVACGYAVQWNESEAMINRNSPIPLYHQLMQEIKDQIDSGRLEPGDAIPTEAELMHRYDLSRATVRQSILHLVSEGYVRRIKAKGTFVNSRPEKPKFIGAEGFCPGNEAEGNPLFDQGARNPRHSRSTEGF